MKAEVFYCGTDDKGRFIDFSKHKQPVRLSGHDKICRVTIRQCTKPTDDTYWAWWDNEKNEFQHIHQSYMSVVLKVPFVPKYLTELGKGKLVPVRIEQL